MEFNYRYKGKSSVHSDSSSSSLAFSPDSLRPPTYFVGELRNKLVFREAISALHSVVTSDLRFKPKDRSEYLQWLQREEDRLLTEFLQRSESVNNELVDVRKQLQTINQQAQETLAPYYKAQNAYFKYLYKADYNAWFVLDPVITINQDEVFFECFSEDESSYGKLSCSFNSFDNISEQACGTTNIDYSTELYNEFQKIRDYRSTTLAVDPDGFNIQTSDSDTYQEVKIDLPESWVRGFLQVSSAMTLPMVTLRLQPMDIHNICYSLRRRKERIGPRSLRFELSPGQPIKVIIEPWNQQLILSRSIYTGDNERSIRIWGRRRLHILERLIPIAKAFTVHLMGDGLPSFYIAELGDMSFTLGLSGWSANDWSRQGNFDLLAPRSDVDETTHQRVYAKLQNLWQASSATLAQQLQLDESTVKSALALYSQSGQVLFDLGSKLYRIRQLTREPLALDKLRFANERDEKAARFVEAGLVKLSQNNTQQQGRLSGHVLDNAKKILVNIDIDEDQRLIGGQCDCYFFQSNQFRRGPCEHMLALRKQTAEKIG